MQQQVAIQITSKLQIFLQVAPNLKFNKKPSCRSLG